MSKFFLTYAPDGRVVVTETRPDRPALVWLRTRIHAETIAARLNDEDDAETSEDGEAVTA